MFRLRIFFTLILLALLFLFYVFHYILYAESKVSTNSATVIINKTIPLILFYTPLFNIGYTLKNVKNIFKNCRYHCSVSDNPEYV